jgi:hypothetical protein
MEEIMRIVKLMLILIIITALTGCAGVRVSQDYDPEIDFSRLNTFTWASETQPKVGDIRVDNPLLDSRIRRAIDEKLINMGYRKVAEVPSDFSVGYILNIQTSYGSSSVGVGTGFGIGGGSTFGGIGIGTPIGGGRSYDELTLAIDFLDPQQGDLLWRGTGNRRAGNQATPEELSNEVLDLVENVLEQLPVSP